MRATKRPEKTPQINLNGGLGNQLFGWALAYSLSRTMGLQVGLNVKNLHQRGFELTNFNIPDISNITFSTISNHSRIRASLRRRFVKLRSRDEFFESGFGFDQRVFESREKTTFNGYFQSWKYFHQYREEIVHQLQAPKNPSAKYLDFVKSLSEKKWIAIHVRRGDYVKFKNYHGLASSEYYTMSLDLVSHAIGDIDIVVFSDDISEAKKIVPNATQYICEEDISSPVENLILMSKATHFIGANSSFSWWAAYIGDQKEKINIFPRPWFAEKNIDTRDLLLPHWLTLGNS